MLRVGILGGGQLARMLILAGAPLGMEFTVFTDTVSSTTASLARHIVGPYGAYRDNVKNIQAIQELDVITYEIETIPASVLEAIRTVTPVFPGPDALATCQDRLKEKELFQALSIPTNRFYPVHNENDLYCAVEVVGFPFILKTRQNGYDGRYHYRIADVAAMQEIVANNSPFFLENTLAESWVPFDREISVLATRDMAGLVVFYDICENRHQAGILRRTINLFTDPTTDPIAFLAREYVRRIVTHFNYVGTIAVEFFVQDGRLLANEIAPRVHNSGHWSIEGCKTSQFENHLRAVTQLPLGSTESWGAFEMVNIISKWPDRRALLEIAGLSLHDYRKTPKPGRKLGHVTTPLDNPEKSSTIIALLDAI